MCCFSRPVRFVGATKIFARADADGRQLLAYAMDVELDEELAMVLPLPVPPGPPDDAVRFLDLSGYERFFDELESAFPPDYSGAPLAASFGPSRGPPEKPKLVVHDVGLFEASFVPTRDDFARLDERFRMPESVWQKLPGYADFGFAVFRLKKGSKRQHFHPMAFSFPRRDPCGLFFPTVHVHDGASVPARARFDHMLYCQVDGVLDALLDWTPSKAELGSAVDVARSQGLVVRDQFGRRRSVLGEAPNADVVLRAPDGVAVGDLSGGGECFAYRVRGENAFALDPWDQQRRTWQVTARTRLPALCRGLREDLPALCAARRESWRLAPLSDALPPHFVNGRQLWTGTDHRSGAPAQHGGPGRVALRVFTDRVEPQDLTLAFAELPHQAELDGIVAELGRLLDRAVGS